jgi:hypothetical protein
VGVYVGIGIVVVLLAALGVVVSRSRPRQETGVANFRRHIDALSPEARREVQDRVRGNMPRGGNAADHDDWPNGQPPNGEQHDDQEHR